MGGGGLKQEKNKRLTCSSSGSRCWFIWPVGAIQNLIATFKGQGFKDSLRTLLLDVSQQLLILADLHLAAIRLHHTAPRELCRVHAAGHNTEGLPQHPCHLNDVLHCLQTQRRRVHQAMET